uniref:Uncharacterized protein n=1 Tax=Setaria viridis TaxID=4556 RepID=A0A4V6D570_SETVI|nr:hypothetical protein SEVIR_6G087550v2 [Setaria viridis]
MGHRFPSSQRKPIACEDPPLKYRSRRRPSPGRNEAGEVHAGGAQLAIASDFAEPSSRRDAGALLPRTPTSWAAARSRACRRHRRWCRLLRPRAPAVRVGGSGGCSARRRRRRRPARVGASRRSWRASTRQAPRYRRSSTSEKKSYHPYGDIFWWWVVRWIIR